MPQNGAGEAAAPTAGTPQASGGAPPQTPAPNYQELHARAEQRAAALEAKVQQAEKDRLDRLKADKAREREAEEQRKRPLDQRLRAEYGDDWYDVVTKAKTGTVAPAHVSAALDEREKSLKSYVDEVLKPLKEENARLRADADQRAREAGTAKAAAYVTENSKKFDLLNRYKQQDNLGAFIEGHYNMTGETWTLEQGATELEKWWASVREMVLKTENGRTLGDTLGTAPSPQMGAPPREDPQGEADEATRKKRRSELWAAWAKPQPARAN